MSFTKINVAGIKIDSCVELKQGHGVLVKLAQQDGSKLVFQSPTCELSWTVVAKTVGNGTGCNLPLSLGSSSDRVKLFTQFLGELHTKIVDLIVTDSASIYGKVLTKAQVSEYLSPLIKDPPADSTFAPVFLPKMTHTPELEITVPTYDVSQTLVKAELVLKKGARACAKISIPYVHVAKATKMFTVRLDTEQILVIETPSEVKFDFDFSDEPVIQSAVQEAVSKRKADELSAAVVQKTAKVAAKMADFDSHDDV